MWMNISYFSPDKWVFSISARIGAAPFGCIPMFYVQCWPKMLLLQSRRCGRSGQMCGGKLSSVVVVVITQTEISYVYKVVGGGGEFELLNTESWELDSNIVPTRHNHPKMLFCFQSQAQHLPTFLMEWKTHSSGGTNNLLNFPHHSW